MELEAIFRLMDHAEASSFSKVELQTGDLRLLLERVITAHAAPVAAASAASLETGESSEKNAVRSPISGVFYLAKEPGAEPFVQPGSRVNKGDTLCIIEAMKTMNHIPAPRAGTVKRILVEDGHPVEYGAPLMIIE